MAPMTTSPFVTSVVVFFGIPMDTVALLLLFPFVATAVAFLRQVVGIKAFGIYTPAIVALVFSVVGLKYGIALYVAVIAVGMATRIVLRRIRILYLPRVAITMTLISFTVLGILMVGSHFQRTGFAAVAVFPLLVLVIIAEKFVAVQIEKGTAMAARLAAETLFVALCGFAILASPALREVIIAYPWIALLSIPLDVLIGRYGGLRLTEYARFRDVLRHIK